VLAARSNGLSDRNGRDAAVACARSYRRQMKQFSAIDVLQTWHACLDEADFEAMLPKSRDAALLKQVAKATAASSSERVFPTLVETAGGQSRIRDTPPTIFHVKGKQAGKFLDLCREVLRKYRNTLALDRRVLLDRYHMLDVAKKVVGTGSVGTDCMAAPMMSIAGHL